MTNDEKTRKKLYDLLRQAEELYDRAWVVYVMLTDIAEEYEEGVELRGINVLYRSRSTTPL